MALSSLVSVLEESNLTEELVKRIKRNERLTICGGKRTERALIASAITKRCNSSILVVVPTIEEAAKWFDLLQLMGWNNTYLYPSNEASPYENNDYPNELIWGQLQVLSELITSKNHSNLAIIATERSLQPHLPPREIFERKIINLSKGKEYDIFQLSVELTNLGYSRVNTIEQEGTWSRRGDILDIFPVSNEIPIRLEYFGDVIEKIREFDPVTQRSLEESKEINITPTNFNSLIAEKLTETLPPIIEQFLTEEQIDNLMNKKTNIKGLGKLIGVAWDSPNNILDYLDLDTKVVIDERKRGVSHAKNWIAHVQQNYEEIVNQRKKDTLQKYPPNLHIPIEDSYKLLDSRIGFDMSEIIVNQKTENTFDLASSKLEIYPHQFGKISLELKNLQSHRTKVWMLSAQPTRAVALLEEHDMITKFISNPNDICAIKNVVNDRVPIALKLNSNVELEGFRLPAWNISLITDKEFFGTQNIGYVGYVRKRKRATSNTVDPTKMKLGDYVVHRNHGIGQFLKIEKSNLSGDIRDYLVLKYEDGILRIAADQLGSVARFRNDTGKPPKINKLGGKVWISTKQKAKRFIKKIAIDLIKLYAERQQSKGYKYPPDGPWQSELEESFLYEPTPDQIKAVCEIKTDMEQELPMDRLVCGDVGFGKTEVAIRAIFKAITAGKQIALLAPTTVLAQQHWRTISDRFSPYPIKVSLLNRFRTSAERKKIIEDLSNGKVDALIGTHQILSKNVQFKNLGLLVIDEEQRFGVNQKEKIKTIKKDIDVLTLSATPIPRTLYMSLSGVREMSLITTPPPLRRPIKTHLSEIDNELIRTAIYQEKERGGQIFYVVPRVEGISEVADKLKRMIPGIKLLIAHGQMDEGQLENSMIAFNAGEAELMLCTTIIESGLDIPRVNTIIIEDSHKFGLSQLYQLRGRVGRSGVQAHAWLFYPRSSSLTAAAKERLKAIREFANLGSGYQLAMRDMEIRGVGNILGVEQSGQMDQIGFDLYMEMLQECLSEIQGQEFPIIEETQIDLAITAFIPGDWISNNEEKIAAYRSATLCRTKDQLIEIARIWTDRYGTIPRSVESLLEIMRLKILAKKCGISRIKNDKPNIILETPMKEPAFKLLSEALPQHLRSRCVYQKAHKTGSALIYARGLGVLDVDKQVEELINWLEIMKDQVPKEGGLSVNETKLLEDKINEKVISL